MEERPQMTALTLPDRLRAHALTNVPMPVEEDMEEAARRIERLERELAEATRWNHAVRVCAEHTGDVVGDGCLVCENAALLEALRELVLVESVVLREYGSGSEHYQQRAIAAWAGAQTALESESPARGTESQPGRPSVQAEPSPAPSGDADPAVTNEDSGPVGLGPAPAGDAELAARAVEFYESLIDINQFKGDIPDELWVPFKNAVEKWYDFEPTEPQPGFSVHPAGTLVPNPNGPGMIEVGGPGEPPYPQKQRGD
jgi:hypothetical protein